MRSGRYDCGSLREAVLAEQHDEWADGRSYLGLDVLAKSRLTLITTTTDMKANTNAMGDESRDVVHHATGLDRGTSSPRRHRDAGCPWMVTVAFTNYRTGMRVRI